MVIVLPPGAQGISLPVERDFPVAEVWSSGAVEQRDAFWQRVLRDRCAAREALQVANGGQADPDPICRAAPHPRPPPRRGEGTGGGSE
jgi:hypothetical protein